MWICHLSSLVMPLRFGLCRIERVRHSVLWLIIGLPLWPSDILRTGIAEPTSLPRLGGAVPRLLELRLPIGSGVIPGAPSLVGRPPIQFKWSST